MRAWPNLKSFVPGKVFAEDEEFDNADTTMGWLGAVCHKLYEAEDAARGNAVLKKWLEGPNLLWNLNSWTRDHLLNLVAQKNVFPRTCCPLTKY